MLMSKVLRKLSGNAEDIRGSIKDEAQVDLGSAEEETVQVKLKPLEAASKRVKLKIMVAYIQVSITPSVACNTF